MELDFGYSWYSYVYLTAGPVVFETVGATSDPVLHLFHISDPTLSWTNNNGGSGYNAKIEAYIPKSLAGLYYVFISLIIIPFTSPA